MKRSFFLIFVFFCLIGQLDKSFAQKGLNALPRLSFLNTDHKIITNKDLPAHTALLLVYFRTDCDECRQTAQIIRQTASKYPLEIWMVSPNSIDNLFDFEYMTGLTNVRNVHVLQDNKDRMHKLFQFSYLPFIVLYDASGRKVRTYDYLPDATIVKKDLAKK